MNIVALLTHPGWPKMCIRWRNHTASIAHHRQGVLGTVCSKTIQRQGSAKCSKCLPPVVELSTL
jgi:hypothetical protein